MSIVQVAKLAGVSNATVSRVINRSVTVTPENVRRVQRAMRELNYRPPTVRRGPKPRERDGLRTRTVAVLFLSADVSLVRAPVFAQMLQGVASALSRQRLSMTVAQVIEPGQVPPNVRAGAADGLLLVGRDPGESLAGILSRYPAVWMGSRGGSNWGDAVRPDDVRIGELAAEHLLAHGHRVLATLNPEPSHPSGGKRLAAFDRVARDAGIPVIACLGNPEPESEILRPFGDETVTQQLVDQLLHARPRPTGVFTPGDSLAVMAYRALARRGIVPGRDIDIVSANNEHSLLAGLHPRPATVDIGAERIGQLAVEQLLWRLRHRDDPHRVTLTVEPAMIDGETLDPQP